MGALPDITVEVAFDSGWATPAADRTWTDITDYVEVHETIGINVGRADELSIADANTLSLVLDNTDGRFTPGNAASPYSPNVKIGRPIRVTVTPSGQSAATRFTGYLDSLPVSWEGSDAWAKVAVTASSRLTRLGAARQLRSVVEEEVRLAAPTAYYTLGEPAAEEGVAASTVTASDSSGQGQAPLVQVGSGTAVTFGDATGPGTDGLTAAEFAGGRHLAGNLTAPLGTTQQWAFCAFNTSTEPATGMYLVDTHGPGSVHGVAVAVTTSGSIQGIVVTSDTVPVVVESPTAYNDGETHTTLIYAASGDVRLYVDGVEVTSDATAFTLKSDIDGVSVGGQSAAHGAAVLTGVVAHAAVGDTAIDGTRAADMHEAASTGFSGDTPAERITRYASYAGIASGEVDADTGTAPISHVDPTGATALDAMRKVEETDGGALFDAADGSLTYRDRTGRYVADSEFEVEAGEDRLGVDYSPRFDLQQLVNTATAKLGDETVTATAVDAGSVDDYGPRAVEIELHTTDPDAPHAAAWWMVNTYNEPEPRVPTLSVNLLEFDAADQAALLGLTVGSRITVTGLPSQAANDTEDYFVEGYSESISLDAYVLTFNVSPAAPWLSTWVLDDADRSELGTTTRLAY